MAKSKKKSKKPSVKVKDLRAKKNPKGGAAVDYFLKIEGIKGEAALHKASAASLKIGSKVDSTLSSTDLTGIKYHK